MNKSDDAKKELYSVRFSVRIHPTRSAQLSTHTHTHTHKVRED